MTIPMPVAVRPVFLALGGFVLVACVANDGVTSCSVEGAKFLSPEATEASICEAFKRRLSDSLAAQGGSIAGKNLSVTLRLHKRGTVEAIVSEEGAAASYPTVGVDVADRPLADKDLTTLAEAVANLLMDN